RQEWSGLKAEPISIDSDVTRHDLQLTLWESEAGLDGSFTFSTKLFEPETISRFAEQFKVLLSAVTTQPDIILSELRRKLNDADRAMQESQAKQLEDTSRERLRASKRRPVSVAETLETI